MTTRTAILLSALAPFVLAACDPARAPPRAAGPGGPRVLATVNGVPITDRDVAHRARRPGAPPPDDADIPQEVLQTVIRDEVVSQEALALGLDADPAFRKRLDDLEAQVRTFRRQELAGRLRAWAQEHAAVTDAEARAWFDRNAAFVRTRYRVQQIFHRGPLAAILGDEAELRSGTPFEEVAWRRFPGVPREGRPPWELGELHWYQLPPAWRGIVDALAPGQVSDVLKDGDRAWIVRLADKRADPAVTFETERERIVQLLGAPKAEELLRRTIAGAQARASVTLRKDGLAAAPPAPRP